MGNTHNHFTQIPNTLLEALILLDLNKRPLKVVLLVTRLTYGCQGPWARIRQVDLMIAGIEESHAKETLKKLLEAKVLLHNGKTGEFQVNEDYLYSKLTENVSLKSERLRRLIGKHLPRTSQYSKDKVTEKVSSNLPKKEDDTSQNSNFDPLPKKEVSASQTTGFQTPKDILKDNLKNTDKDSTIADNSYKEESQVINPKTFTPSNAEESAALEVWQELEPFNPLAFQTTYLWAVRKGLPSGLFYQFTSEIKQNQTIKKPGAVFRKKVEDYLGKLK